MKNRRSHRLAGPLGRRTASLVAVPLAIAMGRSISAGVHEGPGGRSVPVVEEMAGVHHLLVQLERHHPRLAKLVLLRWVGGLSAPQTAEALAMKIECVEHDLHFAQRMLRYEMGARDLGETD